MKEIQVLEQRTIDKIAAGEVVERPSSIVKELCENAIDAGASVVTVEIRGGGIDLIRVTDNGEGIDPSQVKNAFLRHATSKIRQVDDLTTIRSFGFRGEALSSIAAVSRVELITKVSRNLTGIRYQIEGGIETLSEEVGAPDGSTFLVRDLFFNTPARRKFLKSAQTEAGYISDFVSRMALAHPEISIKFMVNNTVRLSTPGNGSQRDVIYSVFGRDVTSALLEADFYDEAHDYRLKGWIGKPQISRSNRTGEITFVNGRLVFNNILSKAVEEGYETFLMQHKFPFVILSFDLPGDKVDVNVHPAKAQVRFSEGPAVFEFVKRSVKEMLTHQEMIIDSTLDPQSEEEAKRRAAIRRAQEADRHSRVPEPFETLRREHLKANESTDPSARPVSGTGQGNSPYERKYPGMEPRSRSSEEKIEQSNRFPEPRSRSSEEKIEQSNRFLEQVHRMPMFDGTGDDPGKRNFGADAPETFDRTGQGMFLDPKHQSEHRMIGQLFDTYWIIEFRDRMYIIDQHAAHEKVMFERLMEKYRNKKAASQMLCPSVIVSLSLTEEALLKDNMEYFRTIGFEIEPFGGHDYAISAVPQDLFGLTEKEFFLEMLDSLSADTGRGSIETVTMRVATMACKAAVKGNTRLSEAEANELITELLSLDNPYNCPHGRPTILSMSKNEIEKKFHRIV